uniref:Homing endonuclease LAGLIDADG domain-containing protein n=1 Tax=Morchella brunnea TaxID=1174671 RepID=A0A8K1MGG3_9PEZI|nr:hypothetical protein LK370_mgp162 [Morchella brunnea]UBU98523.1 hypothetical protein [Morchella brunnea]
MQRGQRGDAEGHIGGYFPSVPTITFRPLVYISQNASDSSIEFLVILWTILDKNLKFDISQNESSKYFHIRLLSRDWDFIISRLIPYLSLVYGDKYKGRRPLLSHLFPLGNKRRGGF